jgi:hypothetical protein
MPVLRQQNVLKARRNPMNHLNHRIAITNRQRPVRAKVILHINDNQRIPPRRLHHPSPSAAIDPARRVPHIWPMLADVELQISSA